MPAVISSTKRFDCRRVLLRADGSASIGMGHVVRSLVLARELLDLGQEVEAWGSSMEVGRDLATSLELVPVRSRECPRGGPDELESIVKYQPDLVIVDGYHFSKEFFRGLDNAGIRYGVIDDNGETQALAPLFVLNQNPSASSLMYSGRFLPLPKLLLGLEYSLLRREFLDLRNRSESLNHSVFLSLGGSDVRGLTLTLATSLSRARFSVDVALGPSVPDRNALMRELLKLQKVHVVPPHHAPFAMAEANILILGAGSSLWEANALSKRVIGLIVADNQVRPALQAEEMGLVANIFDARGSTSGADLGVELVQAATKLLGTSRPIAQVGLHGASRASCELLGMGVESP